MILTNTVQWQVHALATGGGVESPKGPLQGSRDSPGNVLKLGITPSILSSSGHFDVTIVMPLAKYYVLFEIYSVHCEFIED